MFLWGKGMKVHYETSVCWFCVPGGTNFTVFSDYFHVQEWKRAVYLYFFFNFIIFILTVNLNLEKSGKSSK